MNKPKAGGKKNKGAQTETGAGVKDRVVPYIRKRFFFFQTAFCLPTGEF